MSVQLMLPFKDVPVTCPIQAKYHAIAPCLAGQAEPIQQAKLLNLSYSTVSKWLKQFREDGMKGLLPIASYNNREPYTPERIIVSLIYFKCCVPKAANRELARVIGNMTGHQLHHLTVKSLLERYFFWRYEEFQKLLVYPILPDAQSKRREIVKLDKDGWSEQSIAILVKCSRLTVRKWLRRNKEEEKRRVPLHQQLLDWSHAPLKPNRKVYFGTMHTILKLQKKYPTAGWFRLQGYLLKDFGIELGQTTLKKVMKLNRKLHLIPRIERPIIEAEPKEPPRSKEPFTYAFIDIRYLDAKPNGVQLYSCLLLEGFSRTILAGSLTSKQEVGIILRIYYLALLQWGLWKTIVSDNGSQFRSHAFGNTNTNLGIDQHFCEKGRPWQNLIESQFGIQARLGEYLWQQCRNVNEAIEVHRELIRDHNRLPHFAHRKRQDGKGSPLEVLGDSRGTEIDKTQLHQAFSRQVWQRRTNEKGFIRVGRWKIYVEEGLPKTAVELIYWDGKLRAEYRQEKLAEYDCRWNNQEQRPNTIEKPKHFETKYSSQQPELFEVGWLRDPIEEMRAERKSSRKVYSEKLKLPFSEAA